MNLPLQTFSSLVQGMAAAVQAAAAQLLDLTIGSTLRVVLEATASIALWMQWLILQVLEMTRAATSRGSDLDSWMDDFSLERLPASPASGTITFSRFNSSVPALIPVGALVRTTDGTQTFTVTVDSTAPGWSSAQNGYVIGLGIASLDVSVVAQSAGTSSNVQAGAISVLASALSSVDGVLNAAAFVNGIDAESDTAFRLRFQSYMASLSRATLSAVGNAVNTVQQGLNYTIRENQGPSGTIQMANFVIVVDDGSGFPSNTLLSMVQAAVEAVRPIGSTFSIFAPAVIRVDVSLTATTSDTNNIEILTTQVVNAIGAYINSLPVGISLPTSRVVQIAYTTSSEVTNVTGVLLNGQSSDIIIQCFEVIKTGTVVVN
jgi:uncharacterized phage protein gp47/JayE